MNFLPKEVLQKEKNRRISIIMGMIMMIQIPIFIKTIWYKPFKNIQEKQSQLQTLNQQLENPEYQITLDKLALLEELSQLPEQTKKIQWITEPLMTQLFKLLPKNMTIEVLEMTEEQNQHHIKLKGHAKEVISILDYQQLLEAIYGVGYVTSRFEPEQNSYLYEMIIHLNGEQK